MQDQCTKSESARRGGNPELDNALFVRNMRELWRFDPAVALDLDRIDDEELPPVEQTKTEAVTLRRTTPDGRQIYLHSRYNPIAEAEKWTANAIEEDKFCYIVEGFGLGYHIKELFEKLTGDVIIAVIEPDLHALRLALTHLDFTEEIKSKCLVMLTRADKSCIHRRLEPYQAYILMGAKIVSHQHSGRDAPAQARRYDLVFRRSERSHPALAHCFVFCGRSTFRPHLPGITIVWWLW